VIGRKTFETVLTYPDWPYGTKPVIVLSSTPASLKPLPGTMCSIMAATPAEVVDRLAAQGMSHLYIDGGVTIQRFLAAGLIQRLIITRVPVVLGAAFRFSGRSRTIFGSRM
jgi:dihydrofolate reductase